MKRERMLMDALIKARAEIKSRSMDGVALTLPLAQPASAHSRVIVAACTHMPRHGTIIASWGLGWDHVSVSLPDRTPTWAEMSYVRRVFFHDHEVVMQLHPATGDHINVHDHCLHLWRPQEATIPLPPKILV